MRVTHIAAIALAFAVPTIAQATDFHLVYTTYDDGVTSGPATTLDAIITAVDNGFGDNSYTVTGISGTRGALAISFNDNDDFIYYPSDSAGDVVDSFGLTYLVGSTTYQFYKDERGDFAYHEFDGSTGRIVYPATVSLTEVPAPVPEPASWAMMLGGFGMMGIALRRRQRTQVCFASAAAQ